MRVCVCVRVGISGRLIKLLFATKWRLTVGIVEDMSRTALHIVYVSFCELNYVCQSCLDARKFITPCPATAIYSTNWLAFVIIFCILCI